MVVEVGRNGTEAAARKSAAGQQATDELRDEIRALFDEVEARRDSFGLTQGDLDILGIQTHEQRPLWRDCDGAVSDCVRQAIVDRAERMAACLDRGNGDAKELAGVLRMAARAWGTCPSRQQVSDSNRAVALPLPERKEVWTPEKGRAVIEAMRAARASMVELDRDLSTKTAEPEGSVAATELEAKEVGELPIAKVAGVAKADDVAANENRASVPTEMRCARVLELLAQAVRVAGTDGDLRGILERAIVAAERLETARRHATDNRKQEMARFLST